MAPKNWNIAQWAGMFDNIYGHLNSQRQLSDIWMHVVEKAGRISKIARKYKTSQPGKYTKELSGLVADIFAWQNAFARKIDSSLEEAVWKKYPGYCIYCSYDQCRCHTTERNEGQTQKEKPANLSGWQSMFYNIYGEANSSKSLEDVSLHLFEEIGEVAGAIRQRNIFEQKLELADSFAWLNALG